MPQNVEYPTFPLNRNVKFDSISGLKISLKFQYKAKVPDNNLTPCIFFFYMEIHVNVNKNCDNAKRWNVGKPTLPLNENIVCHRQSCYRPTLT